MFQSLFQILPSQKHPQQAYLQRVVQGLAVLAFMALSTQLKAQSSDSAGVKVLGQVTTVSCQLVMTTDPNPSFSSTHNPSLALNLGSTTLTAANAANVGNLMTSGAAANAAGQVGMANAFTGGLGTYLNYNQNNALLEALRNRRSTYGGPTSNFGGSGSGTFGEGDY